MIVDMVEIIRQVKGCSQKEAAQFADEKGVGVVVGGRVAGILKGAGAKLTLREDDEVSVGGEIIRFDDLSF